MNKLNRPFNVLKVFAITCLFLAASAASGLAQVTKGSDQPPLRVDITGIPGDGNGGSIEAFGTDQSVVRAASDSGASAGKTQFEALVITKSVDSATPKLMEACASGKHLSQVQISWMRSNHMVKGGEETYFKVILEDVLISSVRSRLPNQNDPQGAALGAVEEVAFSFGRITWIYSLPNGNTVRSSYDLRANR